MSDLVGNPGPVFSRRGSDDLSLKYLLLKKLKVVPLFIRLMTPNGAIRSLDQRTVIMR